MKGGPSNVQNAPARGPAGVRQRDFFCKGADFRAAFQSFAAAWLKGRTKTKACVCPRRPTAQKHRIICGEKYGWPEGFIRRCGPHAVRAVRRTVRTSNRSARPAAEVLFDRLPQGHRTGTAHGMEAPALRARAVLVVRNAAAATRRPRPHRALLLALLPNEGYPGAPRCLPEQALHEIGQPPGGCRNVFSRRLRDRRPSNARFFGGYRKLFSGPSACRRSPQPSEIR